MRTLINPAKEARIDIQVIPSIPYMRIAQGKRDAPETPQQSENTIFSGKCLTELKCLKRLSKSKDCDMYYSFLIVYYWYYEVFLTLPLNRTYVPVTFFFPSFYLSLDM